MSPESFLLCNLVVLAAFFVRGFTGFGAILCTLPLMALWLPIRLVVPLLAMLSLVNGIWLAWRTRWTVDLREFNRLLVGGLPGVAAGVLLFQLSPDPILRRWLGGTIALLGLWLAWQGDEAPKRACSPLFGTAAGLAGGTLGGLFGLTGPVPVLYLSRRPLDRTAFRATLLLFLTAVDLLRGAGLLIGGALTPSLCLLGLGLYPVSLLGSWLGERLHLRVSERTFRRATGLVLIVMGAVLNLTAPSR